MAEVEELNYVPRFHVPADWQKALTAHLAVFDAICRKHGITYFSAFGGLLGAVRHRGFIPWDNDVDVVMDESNYNRFRQLALDGLLPEGYAFVDCKTEDDYTLLFGRFIDARTSCPLTTSSFNGGVHGLFIDIFILFPLPDDRAQQEEAVAAFLVWEQLLSRYKRRFRYRNDLFFKQWERIKSYERRHGYQAALQHAEKKFRSLIPAFGESTWCLHGSGGEFNGFARLKTEWFFNSTCVPFEGIMLSAPSDPVGFLEQRYGGGWRELPAKRSYFDYPAASLSIPWHVITEDYMQNLDQDQSKEVCRRYAELLVRESFLLHVIQVPSLKAYAKLQARVVERNLGKSKLVKRFSCNEVSLVTPEEANDALCGEFEDVGRLVLDKELRAWHIAPPLSGEILSAYLWARFIARPEFWEVQSVVAYYREGWRDEKYLTNEAACRLNRALHACSDLYNAIDSGDFELLSEASSALNGLCPNTIHASVAKAYLMQSEPSGCLGHIRSLPLDARSNAYIRLLNARLALSQGNRDEGERILSSLVDATNNGMILLSIDDLSAQYNLDINVHLAWRFDERRVKSGKLDEDEEVDIPVRDLSSFDENGLNSRFMRGCMPSRKAIEEYVANERELRVCRKRYDDLCAVHNLTSQRFRVWETLYPRKRLLREAVSLGDIDEIALVLSEYVNASYRVYDDSGFGLFIDQEVLDAAIPVFIRDRGQEFVDDFISKIPDNHKEGIDALLSRKGVAHPYLCARSL